MAAETALLDEYVELIALVIIDDALNWNADLIIIGTHGRSELNRLLLGIVAEGVVRGASILVSLVRAK